MYNWFTALLIAVSLSIANVAYSKSSSSSSRSFSSSSSRSFSSSGSKSSWGSSSTPKSSTPKSSPSSAKYFGSSSSWTTKPQTSTRQTSKVDAARYQSAAKSGKAFTTRESAVADFKTKYSTQYTSKYTSEPTKRPTHIPNVYRANDRTYNVVYDQRYGGYGYWSGGGPGLGTWMMYDAMSDMVMMNTLMSKNSYYVGPPVSNTLSLWITIPAIIIGAIIITSGLIWMINRYNY